MDNIKTNRDVLAKFHDAHNDGDREFYLAEYLTGLLSEYLHLSDDDTLSRSESLFELGLASLSAVEIQYILEKDLKCSIDSTLIFNYPNLDKMTHRLIEVELKHLFKRANSLESVNNEHQEQLSNRVEEKKSSNELAGAAITDSSQLLIETDLVKKLLENQLDT